MNAPSNTWRVNPVRVCDIDMEVTTWLSPSWGTGLSDDSEPDMSITVQALSRPGEFPVFRLARIVGAGRIAPATGATSSNDPPRPLA